MERNKGLKELIEIKSGWMRKLEAEHRGRMQEIAEEIKGLRIQLKLLEGKDKPSV